MLASGTTEPNGGSSIISARGITLATTVDGQAMAAHAVVIG